jgi:hypothetical protein
MDPLQPMHVHLSKELPELERYVFIRNEKLNNILKLAHGVFEDVCSNSRLWGHLRISKVPTAEGLRRFAFVLASVTTQMRVGSIVAALQGCAEASEVLAGSEPFRPWDINDPMEIVRSARAKLIGRSGEQTVDELLGYLETACAALIDHDGDGAAYWIARTAVNLGQLLSFDRNQFEYFSLWMGYDRWDEDAVEGGPTSIALRAFLPLWLVNEHAMSRQEADELKDKLRHSILVCPFLPKHVEINNGELIFLGFWRWFLPFWGSTILSLAIGICLGYWVARWS